MLPPNDYLSMKDYELNRLPDVLARAEQNRLLREAGLMRRPACAPLVWLVPGVPVALAAGTAVGANGSAAGAPLCSDDAWSGVKESRGRPTCHCRMMVRRADHGGPQ